MKKQKNPTKNKKMEACTKAPKKYQNLALESDHVIKDGTSMYLLVNEYTYVVIYIYIHTHKDIHIYICMYV